MPEDYKEQRVGQGGGGGGVGEVGVGVEWGGGDTAQQIKCFPQKLESLSLDL